MISRTCTLFWDDHMSVCSHTHASFPLQLLPNFKNIFIMLPNIHWKAMEKDCDRKTPLSVIQIIQRPPACSSRTSHLQPLQSTVPKSWHILSQTAGLPMDGMCLHVSVHLADYFYRRVSPTSVACSQKNKVIQVRAYCHPVATGRHNPYLQCHCSTVCDSLFQSGFLQETWETKRFLGNSDWALLSVCLSLSLSLSLSLYIYIYIYI